MNDSLIEGIIKARHEDEKHYDRALKERIKKAYLEIDILLGKFKKLDPQLKRVILFGSLAENSVKSMNFDIDLAVIFEKNRLVTKKIKHSTPDEFDWAALGFTIHNVYNVKK